MRLAELEGSVTDVQDALGLPESMRYVLERGAADPTFWCDHWLGWRPHAGGQLLMFRNQAKEAHFVCGRRWGKTRGKAAELLDYAFHHPETVQLNCSITLDQAQIMYDACLEHVNRTGRLLWFLKEPTTSPFPMLRFENGSAIWFRSTQRKCRYIRGHRFHRANYDEASRGARADLDVLLPALIDFDGQFSTTSTPFGVNWYAAECERVEREMELGRRELERRLPPGWQGKELLDYFFHRASTYDNPTLPRGAIDRIVRRLPNAAVDQEIKALFIPLEGSLFTNADLAHVSEGGIVDPDLLLPPSEGGTELERQEGAVYVTAVDWARKKSWCVAITIRIDCRPWRAVARRRWHRADWTVMEEEVAGIQRHWRSHLRGDATGVGDSVHGHMKVPIDDFIMGPITKTNGLVRLQRKVQARELVIPPWEELVNQLRWYTWDEDPPPDEDEDAEARGETWDDLMALMMGVDFAETVMPGPLQIDTTGSRAASKLQIGSTSTRRSPLDRL